MPSRNTVKIDVAESYYHVYARGANKQVIFVDERDFEYFEKLFFRYLTRNDLTNSNGEAYPYYGDKLKLLSFCLMPNHFHLLVFQSETGVMSAFMRSLMTSYSRYFNKRYKRTGSLFESRYKASLVGQQEYLEHISRYIHLNPRYWQRYRYSSFRYYTGEQKPDWLQPDDILGMFANKTEYRAFVADYESHKKMLDAIKRDLADT